MKVDSDIDWKALALKYELSGGFIKNAVLSALSAAVNRDKVSYIGSFGTWLTSFSFQENPVISQHDLEQGSKLQLRGRLRMIDFDRRGKRRLLRIRILSISIYAFSLFAFFT